MLMRFTKTSEGEKITGGNVYLLTNGIITQNTHQLAIKDVNLLV